VYNVARHACCAYKKEEKDNEEFEGRFQEENPLPSEKTKDKAGRGETASFHQSRQSQKCRFLDFVQRHLVRTAEKPKRNDVRNVVVPSADCSTMSSRWQPFEG
jgi:hypothetical protein